MSRRWSSKIAKIQQKHTKSDLLLVVFVLSAPGQRDSYKFLSKNDKNIKKECHINLFLSFY